MPRFAPRSSPPRVTAAILGARALPADRDGIARVHVKESESVIIIFSPPRTRAHAQDVCLLMSRPTIEVQAPKSAMETSRVSLPKHTLSKKFPFLRGARIKQFNPYVRPPFAIHCCPGGTFTQSETADELLAPHSFPDDSEPRKI